MKMVPASLANGRILVQHYPSMVEPRSQRGGPDLWFLIAWGVIETFLGAMLICSKVILTLLVYSVYQKEFQPSMLVELLSFYGIAFCLAICYAPQAVVTSVVVGKLFPKRLGSVSILASVSLMGLGISRLQSHSLTYSLDLIGMGIFCVGIGGLLTTTTRGLPDWLKISLGVTAAVAIGFVAPFSEIRTGNKFMWEVRVGWPLLFNFVASVPPERIRRAITWT